MKQNVFPEAPWTYHEASGVIKDARGHILFTLTPEQKDILGPLLISFPLYYTNYIENLD